MAIGRMCVVAGLLLASSSSVVAVPHAVAGPSATPLPTADRFYSYSGKTPLAKFPPGTIIKQRSIDVAVGTTTTPYTAEQLLYRTSNELGKPTVTVTTVISPPSASLKPQIVAYLSFYDALGSECDPSYTLNGGDAGSSSNEQQAELEEGVIANYVAAGDIVTIPDYEGEKLDWAAGQESGVDTLDGIRATEAYLKVPHSTPVGMSGYSGGSIAADWASELAPSYASGLNIVGVAEGGLPVDFAHNTRYIDGSTDWSGVIPAVLDSLTRAFHKKLTPYLSAKGRRITSAVQSDCIGSFLGSYPGLTVASLLKPKYHDFLAIPVFARIINKVEMGTAPGHPAGPLFMAVGDSDGTGDGVMVAGDVEALAHEYCRQGVSVKLSTYPLVSHEYAAVPFEVNASSFLADRFAGVPFTSRCSSIGKGNSLKPLKITPTATAVS